MKKIGIIGGGAAGMFAAIVASKKGAEVTIIEHGQQLGKKILATGNGKCNLTNLKLSQDDYYSNHPAFVMDVIKRCNPEKTLQLFEEFGLLYKERNGYVYPISNQASTVLELLKLMLKRLDIKILTQCNINKIQFNNEKPVLYTTSHGKLTYDAIIIATGSKAAPKTGSDGSGYEFASRLGHNIIPIYPALVQLRSNENYFKSISGVRFDGTVTLQVDNKIVSSESGEIQITDYGLSGIPIFQLSRMAILGLVKKKKVAIVTDFLPQLSEKELLDFLGKKCNGKAVLVQDYFAGLLNSKLNLMFIKQLGLTPKDSSKKMTKEKQEEFVKLVKHFLVPIHGYNSFEQCQVCQGGIDLGQVTSEMESKIQKNLFFAGEVVDVDGKCGGYNLQWAWSSGYVAGNAACRKE